MEEEELIDAIKTAVKLMGGIPYFPVDEFARAGIIGGVMEFADSVEGIQWMAQHAVARMKKWAGVPELRGIYCAGGFMPRDGRREESPVMELGSSLPAYYLPAPKLLAPPPMEPAEEANLKAEMEALQKRIDDGRARRELRRILFDKRYEPEEPPEWLKTLN
jgi:hypothetical protein